MFQLLRRGRFSPSPRGMTRAGDVREPMRAGNVAGTREKHPLSSHPTAAPRRAVLGAQEMSERGRVERADVTEIEIFHPL